MTVIAAPAMAGSGRRRHANRAQRFRLIDLTHIPIEDGFRYEILEGELVVTLAPGRPHAVVAMRLMANILNAVTEAGLEWTVLGQPINLDFENATTTNHCEPDMSIFKAPAHAVATDTTLTPHIVIEIVSPGNPENDYVRKVEAYAMMGIPEYWIVDPGNRAVTYLLLNETIAGYRYTGQPASTALPELQMAPETLFEGIS